jgi:two-component system, chemotaxis family, sensor kinase CheA
LHIIRNCIDHGIENPEGRKANNKPENGTIRFVASQSGNYIYIQISDDGNGIDKDYIRTKAIEKGFIQPSAHLSDRELLELIFLPGFSTAESLTQVSGRGVGMDVVKRAITNLRGTVEIETEKGKGTTFTIKLQQTISIMDTLLIRAGKMHFAIILEEVEICELESHQTLFDRQNNHLQIGSDLLPFVSLRQAFSIEGEAPETERIVVIKRQNLRYAIVVDSIIGQFQAVIKPLGSVLKHKEYLSGASIMGDGNIAFMLDTQNLSKTYK